MGETSVSVTHLQSSLHEFIQKSQSEGAGKWESGGFNKKASNSEDGWL